jgi:predicted ATPase
LCAEHGLASFLATSNLYLGAAMTAAGRGNEGIALIENSLAMFRAAGFGMARPKFLSILADACLTTGRFGDGLRALTEAEAVADEHEEQVSTAEIHRIKGELLLRQDPSKIAEAQSCFERAIEVAHSQSAKSYELRGTTSLARLLRDIGRRDEACAMLAEIYNWFTEGFDTADLKDAKALLDELSG